MKSQAQADVVDRIEDPPEAGHLQQSPQVEIAIIPGAGHDLTIVQADLVDKLILDFLAEPYAFPIVIDPEKRYLFYIHGKIIEEQGLPAVSPEFGEYQYEAILETLSGRGFEVISEVRAGDTLSDDYAHRVAGQLRALLAAGVPQSSITVVGASKGAAIAMLVSHYLPNRAINYVILGGCHPDTVNELMDAGVALNGRALSIYDSVDNYAGSCEALFATSPGLIDHDEIVVHVGTGHGILYLPLNEWVLPTAAWGDIN